ncbi:MAG TPA: hypothetical protein VMU62_09725 [Acidobacteriaceae bacterium]|nr:hypothetical protein [Acidobacteriaceae bacterium]
MPSLLEFSTKYPGWRSCFARGWAVLCVGLILMTASLQACHFHAPGSQSGPDHCPICIALHPALPAATHVAPMASQAAPESITPSPLSQYHRIWAFHLSSRPPPAPQA